MNTNSHSLLIVEPFMSGSHALWVEGVRKQWKGEVIIHSLPGRHWKWRMYGGAISLAEKFNTEQPSPDVILCSDMLDLGTYLGLIKIDREKIKVILYMHENQLTYPWSNEDADRHIGRDRHYAFINYTSALIADEVHFNTRYHMRSFIEALPLFLKAFPDKRGLSNVNRIEEKSMVCPILLDLQGPQAIPKKVGRVPLILWNHRWEYDKGPVEFFESLIEMKRLGLDFKLAVTGESYQNSPSIFQSAKYELNDRIYHWGYVDSRAEYLALLYETDIIPITSIQDFFGISIVEAIDTGAYPLLPKRLSYPELLVGHESYLYEGSLLPRLVQCIESRAWEEFTPIDMSRYSLKFKTNNTLTL